MKPGVSSFLAAILTAAIFISCCTIKSEKTQVETRSVISPFSIHYSESGGITGMKQSYQLESTGELTLHQQLPGTSDSVVWAGTLSADKVISVQKELQACGLSDMSLTGRGSMTSRLLYATADTSYEFSWAGAGAVAAIPEELKSWVLNFKSFFNPKK